MSFKFSLISDMHVDFPQPRTPYDDLEKFVIVAGDTSNGLGGLKFLNKLKRKGFEVFAVDGNHEHYANDSQSRDIPETEQAFYRGLDQAFAKRITDDLRIIGCNGWYGVDDERAWLGYMNDGRYAGPASMVNAMADQHAAFLDVELSETQGRAIVVTHTAPCLDTLHPAYAGHYSNEWYWNPSMEKLLQKHAPKIAVWVHGHTHASSDKIVHGVRVVCNPRGYPRENPGWKPLTVEV